MGRRLSMAGCLAALVAAASSAAIIDRIAVSVGNRVITETDVDREMRITAFLNNTLRRASARKKSARPRTAWWIRC